MNHINKITLIALCLLSLGVSQLYGITALQLAGIKKEKEIKAILSKGGDMTEADKITVKKKLVVLSRTVPKKAEELKQEIMKNSTLKSLFPELTGQIKVINKTTEEEPTAKDLPAIERKIEQLVDLNFKQNANNPEKLTTTQLGLEDVGSLIDLSTGSTNVSTKIEKKEEQNPDMMETIYTVTPTISDDDVKQSKDEALDIMNLVLGIPTQKASVIQETVQMVTDLKNAAHRAIGDLRSEKELAQRFRMYESVQNEIFAFSNELDKIVSQLPDDKRKALESSRNTLAEAFERQLSGDIEKALEPISTKIRVAHNTFANAIQSNTLMDKNKIDQTLNDVFATLDPIVKMFENIAPVIKNGNYNFEDAIHKAIFGIDNPFTLSSEFDIAQSKPNSLVGLMVICVTYRNNVLRPVQQEENISGALLKLDAIFVRILQTTIKNYFENPIYTQVGNLTAKAEEELEYELLQ